MYPNLLIHENYQTIEIYPDEGMQKYVLMCGVVLQPITLLATIILNWTPTT